MSGAAKSNSLLRMAGTRLLHARLAASATAVGTRRGHHRHHMKPRQILLQKQHQQQYIPALQLILTSARRLHGGAPRLVQADDGRGEEPYDPPSLDAHHDTRVDVATQQKATERILDKEKYPIGSFTPETWFEAEDLFYWWTRQHTQESVDVCFRFLDRIIKEREHHITHSTFFPDQWVNVDILNRVLNDWRVVWWKNDMREHTPEKVMTRVVKYATEDSFPVNEKSFYLITEAMHRRGNSSEILGLAEKALSFCLAAQNDGNDSLLPSADFFNLVMHIWARSGRPEARHKIENLITIMNEFGIPLRQRTYLFAMMTWGDLKSIEGAEKAQELLFRMYQDYKHGNELARPTERDFHQCIIAWLSSGAKHAAEHAESLIVQFLELRSLGDIHKNRSATELMNGLIHWLGKQKNRRSTLKAQEIFEKMSGVDRPDNTSYLGMIQAWASLGEARRVEELIKKMQIKSRDRRNNLTVDSTILTAAISAWAKSKAPDRVERAESILKMMTEGGPEVRPNTLTYNAYLNCLATTKTNFVGSKAEAILSEMKKSAENGDHFVTPDWVTYSLVIRIWEQFGIAGRAIGILNQMIEDYQNGNELAKPDSQCFNHVLGAYAKSKNDGDAENAMKLLQRMKYLSERGNLDVRPTVHSYSRVLSAISNTRIGRSKAARQAENVLNDMRARYEEGSEVVKPNSFCYNAVMNAWARAGKPECANKILEEMYSDFAKGNEDAKPSVASFCAIIKALAYSKEPGAGKKAEEIVERMNSLHELGLLDAGPNVITYTTLILCYGLSNDPDAAYRADEIYRRMEDLHRMGKLDAPNRVTLNTLRRAWITSTAPEKEARVKEIEREMDERFGKVGAW